jgi:hypothetical protein
LVNFYETAQHNVPEDSSSDSPPWEPEISRVDVGLLGCNAVWTFK